MNTNVNTAAKTVRGKCRLCLRRRVLRESHFMPAAVYPKKRKPMFGMGDQTILNPEQIKAHLLCTECEQRFDRNGESHVLYWLAPKAKAGKSPLQRKLREVEPVFREEPPSGNLYFASMLGIDAEKFAYFGLSLLWRAAAHRWPFPNGKKSLRSTWANITNLCGDICSVRPRSRPTHM